MTNTNKKRINLEIYNQELDLENKRLQPSALHSILIKYNDAFGRNLNDAKNSITIHGCETPIHFILDPEEGFTFVCRSKVLRAYLFCLVINKIFDRDCFRFDYLVERYNFLNYLNDGRIKALQNAEALLERIANDVLLEKMKFEKYYISAEDYKKLLDD